MSALLAEIRDNWKLEAKSENTDRYFFHVKEVETILSGSRSYVIGRKGTGKTAISEHIAHIQHAQTFSEKLSFKNFPFNELYDLQNKGYTPPNQYITIWKYIIYSFVCKMMSRNHAVESSVRLLLEQLYSPEPVSSLQKWIRKWTASSFELKVLGTGGKLGLHPIPQSTNWIERVDVLETVVARYADESTYYVIFEDYKNIMEKSQYKIYTELLTGLFKAVQDIKSVFKDSGSRVFPIILLRDDIYSLITDPDKTKWDDYRIELEWDKQKIKDLVAFRISRAIDAHSHPLPFGTAWDRVFINAPVMVGNQQQEKMSIFDYITRSTHLRPRDFTKYMQSCADASVRGSQKIYPSIVKKVDKQFSSWLRRELVDEIHGVIPEINAILDIISQIRKQTFSIHEFRKAFSLKVKTGAVPDIGADFVLKILFLFSVIGNQPRQKNQTVFRYTNKDAELNFSEPLVVHRGLYKALQII